jgi:ABC-type nitrate/sulfonate/bicarbonate transport system substrate-binding protein
MFVYRPSGSRRARLLIAVGLAGLAVAAVGVPSATAATPTIKVAISSPQADFTDLYVAQLNGLYKKAGVNVKIVTASANQNTMLISGQVDLADGATGSALGPVNAGKAISVVAAVSGQAHAGFGWGTAGINKLTDCKTVATQPPGFAPYSWAVVDKKLFHASYNFMQVPDAPSAQAAIKAGRADCTVFAYGAVAPLVADKTLHLIFDPRQKSQRPFGYPIDVVEGAIYGVTSTLKGKRDAVTRFLKAYLAADAWVKKTSTRKVAQLLKKDPGFQPFTEDALKNSLDYVRYGLTPDKGLFTAESWTKSMQFVIDGGLNFVDMYDSRWSFSRRVDMSYLRAASAKSTS